MPNFRMIAAVEVKLNLILYYGVSLKVPQIHGKSSACSMTAPMFHISCFIDYRFALGGFITLKPLLTSKLTLR